MFMNFKMKFWILHGNDGNAALQFFPECDDLFPIFDYKCHNGMTKKDTRTTPRFSI